MITVFSTLILVESERFKAVLWVENSIPYSRYLMIFFIARFLFQIHHISTFCLSVYILEWGFCVFTKPEQQLRKFNRRSNMSLFHIYHFRSNSFTGNKEPTKVCLALNMWLCSSVGSSAKPVSLSKRHEFEPSGSQNIFQASISAIA